jgi:hypothetical protein
MQTNQQLQFLVYSFFLPSSLTSYIFEVGLNFDFILGPAFIPFAESTYKLSVPFYIFSNTSLINSKNGFSTF